MNTDKQTVFQTDKHTPAFPYTPLPPLTLPESMGSITWSSTIEPCCWLVPGVCATVGLSSLKGQSCSQHWQESKHWSNSRNSVRLFHATITNKEMTQSDYWSKETINSPRTTTITSTFKDLILRLHYVVLYLFFADTFSIYAQHNTRPIQLGLAQWGCNSVF